MTELETKIKNFADAYYQGRELISDSEYDALIERLKKENPESSLLNDVVGTDIKGINKKYKLPVTMGTLEKCMTVESFKEWYSKHPHNDLVAEEKIDGNGILLHYKNSKLYEAFSRGDSEYGENITKNVMLFKDIPLVLNDSFTGYIRGEAIMFNDIFVSEYSKNMKNPRNAVAGIIKRLDGEGCDDVNFIAYDVFGGFDKTEADKISFLSNNGFDVPKTELNPSYDKILELRDNIKNEKKYNIDGIVIKQNKVDKNDLMRKTPLNNVAVKPEMTIAVTTVNNIRWQLAGSVFSPVADVDPVELCGTTVVKASLANVNIMKKLNIGIGDEVEITKRGEIIPRIEKVIKHVGNSNWNIPTVCPVCGGEVKINPSGLPECINPDCQRKSNHKFARMFKVFGVKGAGDAFLKNVEESGIDFKEFFDMCLSGKEDILNKFAGGINGQKIKTQMMNVLSSPVSIEQFLAIFDVKLFDEKKLALVGNYSIDQLLNISKNELLEIKGFADITADAFINFMKDYKNEIKELEKYFTFKAKKIILNKEEKNMGKLNGLSFCFTGKAVMPRKDLQKIVVDNGGENKDSVIKGLSYLVTDDTDSGSSKNVKAAKLGIPTITSIRFLEMVK